MNTALIALAGTAAAVALTWFFCMRPMLRRNRTADQGCCAGPGENIDEQIRTAREELARLHGARPSTGPDVVPGQRREA
jgi:hypothetical protein